MGYRSIVTIAVETATPEDFTTLIARFPADKWQLVLNAGATATDTGLRFSTGYVKWYSARLIGFQETGYEEVNALEDFYFHAQDQEMLFSLGDGGVASVGVLMRVGDELGDTDQLYYGDGEDLPDWYELADITTEISSGSAW